MDDAEKIAAGLTEAQRTMLRTATVIEPHSVLPNYWIVSIDCRNQSSADAEELQKAGLVNLPIRRGNRSSTIGFDGEILPLGREVRAILERPRT
jgi:hypothetical protein